MKHLLLSLAILISGALVMGAGTVVNTPGIPAGAILAFGGGSCPQGWLAADGVAKSSTTYKALDAYYGTTWGARSGGNFQIPDLNSAGRYLRGGTAGTLQAQGTVWNNMTAILASGTVTGSLTNGTLNSGAAASNGDHTHPIRSTDGAGYYLWVASTGGSSPGYYPNNVNNNGGANYFVTTTAGAHGHTVTGSVSTAWTGSVGTGLTKTSTDTETRPITATVLYCIKS